MMNSFVPFFERRKLFSTTSSQEVGKVRAALTQMGISFHIDQSDMTPPVGMGGRLSLHPDAPLPAYEYTFYVHKDDLEMAESVLNGVSLE